MVTGFTVMWERDTSLGCSDRDEDTVMVNGEFTSYEITGLEEDSGYSITVKVFNGAGSSSLSNTVTGSTQEAGAYVCETERKIISNALLLYYSSL